MDIIVIGCGVSGLTTGLCLLQAGHTISIWAKALPPQTTSNIAAAFWEPYKAYPADKVTAWGAETFQVFKQLQSNPSSGVIMTTILDLKPAPCEDPPWAKAVESFRHARSEELLPGYMDGYVFETPVIDTSIYLDYLMQTFRAQGGKIVQRMITDLGDVFTESAVVVNCTGLGARELVGDQDLHPSRGQVVRIKHNGFRQILVDDEGPNKLAYIVPRTHDMILGGTDDEYQESTMIDPDETQAILRRCANLAPQFARITSADILGVACGLRPVRSAVRVEVERVAPDRWLIHNYGHGGAGITLSWGCGTEVVKLVATIAYHQ